MLRNGTIRIPRRPMWLSLGTAGLCMIAVAVFAVGMIPLTLWMWWGLALALVTVLMGGGIAFTIYRALRWRTFPDDGTRCRWCGLRLADPKPHRCPECRREVPVGPGSCGDCGYDLTGNASGRCPECGKSVGIRPTAKPGRRLAFGVGLVGGALFAAIAEYHAAAGAPPWLAWIARGLQSPGHHYTTWLDNLNGLFPGEWVRLGFRANVVFYAVLGAAMAYTIRRIYLFFRWNRVPFDGRTCMECGHDLTGNASGVCPECGTPIPAIGASPQAPPPDAATPVQNPRSKI